MSKAVLISIRPERCEKIINGKKTIEVRKTAPKCGVPVRCYIYCTTGGKGALMVKANAGAALRLADRRRRPALESGGRRSAGADGI